MKLVFLIMNKGDTFEKLRKSKNNEFIQELKSLSKIIDERDAQQYFSVLMDRLNGKPTNLITKEILSSIYKVISVRSKFLDIFAKKRYILDLPYSAKIYNREILNILYVVIKKYPETIVNGLEDYFKDLIKYECKKSLLLLYHYTNKFEILEKDQTKILGLLVDDDCSQRLSADATINEYIVLLNAVFERSESFRNEYSEQAWKIMDKILHEASSADQNRFQDKPQNKSEFISTCYMVLARIQSYYQKDEVDFELARSHLEIEEIQNSVLSLLFYTPFEDQSIGKNEKFISCLIKLSQKYGLATLVLINICSKSKNAIDYLSQNNEWLIIDPKFGSYTLDLFLIVYKSKYETMELGKEFADFLIRFCDSSDKKESNKRSIVKIISTLLRRVRINTTVLDELLKNETFFDNLIESTIETRKSLYFYHCALIADTIFQFIKLNNLNDSAAAKYINLLPKFCRVINSGISLKSKSLYQFCLMGWKISEYKVVKDEFNNLDIQSILREKADDEKINADEKKAVKKFLNRLTKKDK